MQERLMRFKLIIVFTEDDKTDAVVKAAREKGATGSTGNGQT